jgi:hypothetical protein
MPFASFVAATLKRQRGRFVSGSTGKTASPAAASLKAVSMFGLIVSYRLHRASPRRSL